MSVTLDCTEYMEVTTCRPSNCRQGPVEQSGGALSAFHGPTGPVGRPATDMDPVVADELILAGVAAT
jgi:hypothetical protein